MKEKVQWIKSKEFLLGRKCIRTAGIPKESQGIDDATLCGKRGMVWRYSETTLYVALKPGRFQTKVFKLLGISGRKAQIQDEVLLRVPMLTSFEALQLLDLLKISPLQAVQIRYATNWAYGNSYGKPYAIQTPSTKVSS
jgi:hypothetical protein